MKRYIEQREALKRVTAGEDRDRLERWLVRQPTAPHLISRKTAAEILGVKSPHIARFEKQGRMPEPIPVEGTAPAYIREEVEALRDALERERAARRAKKEES
jgi:predicted DNA-binding transcriptional regulator AlpA